MTGLLGLAAAVLAGLAAQQPAQAAGVGQYGPPEWLPVRAPAEIGCVVNNCAGPYHGYWALDLLDPSNQPGDPVYAAGAGQFHVISRSTQCGGPGTAGNYAYVDHGSGVRSYYYHFAAFSAADGAWVDQNTVLGSMGSTGYNDPCPTHHLHFEVRVNGTRVDPGKLKACHGSTMVTYPDAAGGASWNGFAPYRTTVRSDGTGCGGSRQPFGSFDEGASPEAGRLHVRGWAIDDDARTSPVTIHAYVGGEAGTAGAEGHDLGAAGVSRPDVGAAHGGAGDLHGFDTVFTTSKTGAQPVCLYAINIGGGHNPLLGCKTVTIQDPQPFGSLDTADGGAGTLHVRGWAVDRNAGTAPVAVHVYVGGEAGTAGAEGHDIGAATTDRPDIGAAHPWAGSAHGFDTVIQTQKRGPQQVCGYAINVGPGGNQLLGCRSTTIGELPAPPPAELARLSGADRLGTAIAISKDSWADQQAQSVVLARWDAFPDALAGTPLAVAKGAPLLLTPSNALNAGIAAEIQRVLPAGRTVYLLGGATALSQGVADAVTRLGYTPARLGGADRYATAVTISTQLGTPGRIFEATGLSFQSALISGVAAAGVGNGVVVLTADGAMPAATKAYLDGFPAVERVAVGPEAGTADPGAVKVAGPDSYATARLLAERYFPSPSTAALASGTVFADALAGGAHIGRRGGPLLLSEPTRLPSTIVDYLSANRTSIDDVALYGGAAALSASVEDAVRANLRQ